MNADARDIALYERCREIARETGVVITVKYDAFFLSSDDNESLGAVVSLDELYGFLCLWRWRTLRCPATTDVNSNN